MKAIAMLFSLALTTTAQNIPADPDTIAGIVTSAKGPEAGVWGIAETTGLPTKFAKIVVTDDRGRYLLPDLPKATYSIRVRGYGLVDSPKVQSPRGTTLNLKVTLAPDARAAAEYYPASFWYSLLRVPDKPESRDRFSRLHHSAPQRARPDPGLWRWPDPSGLRGSIPTKLMPLVFPTIGNAAAVVGRTPSSRGWKSAAEPAYSTDSSRRRRV